jgi:hypothetical protein
MVGSGWIYTELEESKAEENGGERTKHWHLPTSIQGVKTQKNRSRAALSKPQISQRNDIFYPNFIGTEWHALLSKTPSVPLV